ncbi:zinc finger HIT domain-containing protein 2-like isoform X2 [Acanthaster planci]|uniref:Zinc finger HIT domain-containing protein 2-like isoform X2 n=1 Tax=Acanthaster planci TaxID=133434 RepID=A0A8B7ZTX4_ACAPL|nr:zinc finger HIT domain-containing protein 2-like isoform X2 [Acanthaster planci]
MAARYGESTTREPSEITAAKTEAIRVCELCLKEPSKYKCPRCGVLYCSLSCYRGGKHSDCSQTFYKDNFMEIMKNEKKSEDDHRRMLEILHRVDAEYKPLFDDGAEIEEDEEDSETAEMLEERIAGLDLDKDTDLIWEQLTEKERRDFESMLHAGHLGNLVPLWKAWWEEHDQNLVKEVGIEPLTPTPLQSTPAPEKLKEPSYADEIEVDLEKMAADFGLNYKEEEKTNQNISELSISCPCPSILKKIPKLSELLRNKKPSESVMYNLLNILYACVVRLYNGAHRDLPLPVAQNLLELSSTLSDNVNYSGTEESLASAIHNALKSLSTSNVFSTSILQDVIHILLGAAHDAPISYVHAALSDLHRLFGAAKKQLAKDTKHLTSSADPENSNSSKENKPQLQKTCFSCQKKVEFFLAWVAENQDKPRILFLEVDSIYRSRRLLDEQHSATKFALEKQWGGTKPPPKPKHRLIEELS